jgi:hypothetical protein
VGTGDKQTCLRHGSPKAIDASPEPAQVVGTAYLVPFPTSPTMLTLLAALGKAHEHEEGGHSTPTGENTKVPKRGLTSPPPPPHAHAHVHVHVHTLTLCGARKGGVAWVQREARQ